ncbi:Hypothetical predicted protein [Mytilus galloprovincialis]|uniref:VWFD domain-containing protein n=1 Tax=Mytilus galloprovincialis TaxID=29158 RepID=A0A8B6G9X0_MYTGA|nr:Hypothetical predicted protein [Mytilus galloprovincialis]
MTYDTFEADPCDTTEIIDDWQRSVAFVTDTTQICDNYLAEGWYRVTSPAGELMPTECPVRGSRCNTEKPIYLYADDLPVGENAYPALGMTVNRTAYSSHYGGSCKYEGYEIKIKNCDGYYVYYLKSTIHGCYSAYCFGDQLPCENGTTSENGFPPGCGTYPDITVSPYIHATLLETDAVNEHNTHMLYSKATFECRATDLQDGYNYKTRWYINDIEINDAKLEALSKTDIEDGLGRMLEEHWTSKFKPNMIVKCTIQVGGDGFGTYGPQHHSEVFFAGLKIEPSSTTDYQVLEGQELNITAELTMPLSCNWPIDDTEQKIKDIKLKTCQLVLLNGVPDYQGDGEKCANGITEDGLIFNSQLCGIKFSHSNWQEKQVIKIVGQIDQLVNVKDRIVFLRLYNTKDILPNEPIWYWKYIHLPDIKVYVKDADIKTLGKSCYSQNDPHMRTFDQKTYELQSKQQLTEGEYIMYKHITLPLQVNAFYKKCYTTVLCNCGIAVRSGDSLFVANYCDTNYKGQIRTNRYMKQRLCDDQSLIVTKSGNTYEITLPTGTKVTFNYGSTYVDGINIIPSVLDTDATQGLCGIYNGNANDDFTPRDQLAAVKDVKTFASSWQYITEEWQNGWTEASAEQHCTYHFEKAPAFNVCSEYVPYVDKTPFINGCIKDIKSSGGDSWLKVTIRNFASVCLQESKRLEILTVTNSTNSTGAEKPIASIIRESICPEDCSNNGLCIDETLYILQKNANATMGIMGRIVPLTNSQAPTVIRNAFEDLCDSSKKPCRTFIVPGYDFINGSGLSCKYTSMSLKSNGTTTLLEEGDTFTHPGSYASSFFMYLSSLTLHAIYVTQQVLSCDKLTTCSIQPESPAEESKTTIVIIALVVANIVIILIVMAVIIFKWKLKQKQSSINDSTFSLPNTTRNIAPKSHLLTTDNIFLSEKFRSESACVIKETKCGWK